MIILDKEGFAFSETFLGTRKERQFLLWIDNYLYLRKEFKVTYFKYKSMKKQLLIIFCIISIGFTSSGQTVNKIKSVSKTKEVKPIPDFNVALKFINDYISFCLASEEKKTSISEEDWVARNQLVTKSFKA
jgi:hypothetical protein